MHRCTYSNSSSCQVYLWPFNFKGDIQNEFIIREGLYQTLKLCIMYLYLKYINLMINKLNENNGGIGILIFKYFKAL